MSACPIVPGETCDGICPDHGICRARTGRADASAAFGAFWRQQQQDEEKLRLAKRRQVDAHTGKGQGGHNQPLTLEQKREIVRRVKGRFESPTSVAKSMGVSRNTVGNVMRSYANGEFTMGDPS